MPVDIDMLVAAVKTILVAIKEDPTRPGLEDTPRRVAEWWREFIEYNPGNTETTFEAIQVDQMVVVSGMRVWSLCEHHLLPFWCDISIGYITKKRVLGLSKFARVAHKAAHRLQVQENLVNEIAKEIMHLTGSNDVAVLGRGEHLCMIMRGIKTPGIMTSSIMHGCFRKEASSRDEFLKLALERRD